LKGVEAMAFVTGSVRYGEPTDESDIDLVILTDRESAVGLILQCDSENASEYIPEDDSEDITTAIRFGVLNVILHTCPKKYEAWKKGTQEMIEKRPVTRAEAVDCIQKHLAERDFN